MQSFNAIKENNDIFQIIDEMEGVGIFGGYFRDVYLNQQERVRDMDVLIEAEQLPLFLEKMIRKTWNLTTPSQRDIEEQVHNPDRYVRSKYLDIILSAHYADFSTDRNLLPRVGFGARVAMRSYKMDIIVINCPLQQYVEELPISSSGILYTNQGVYQTEDFKRFLETGEVIVDQDVPMHYLQKMQERFPTSEFTFKDSTGFFVQSEELQEAIRLHEESQEASPQNTATSVDVSATLDEVFRAEEDAPEIPEATARTRTSSFQDMWRQGSVVNGFLRGNLGRTMPTAPRNARQMRTMPQGRGR